MLHFPCAGDRDKMRGLPIFLMLMMTPGITACTYFQSNAVEHYDNGRARSDKRDFDGAIDEYTKAIEADPTFFKAYLNRGIVRENKNDYRGAVADFTKVIELEPTNLQAYMSRGSSRIFTKDLDGAVEDFTKAIELDTRPAMQKVNYRNRSAAYNVQKKFDLAAADENKAAELEKIP
jgi:tetratricopeptide (TPR) repeat protein